jgi:hypothetical protein
MEIENFIMGYRIAPIRSDILQAVVYHVVHLER